jgi:hypothetical protein
LTRKRPDRKLVTAPVLHRTWGLGVPGELDPQPGTAHSYWLSASLLRGPADGSAAEGRIGSHAQAQVFLNALPLFPPAPSFPTPFHLQVSQANTMKRGHYV